jgi:hypothetical protein
MISWLGQGRLGFAYVSVKPEFGNHFSSYVSGILVQDIKAKPSGILRPVRYCGIYG